MQNNLCIAYAKFICNIFGFFFMVFFNEYFMHKGYVNLIMENILCIAYAKVICNTFGSYIMDISYVYFMLKDYAD